MYTLLIMELHLCYSMIHCNILLYVLYWTQNIDINIFLGDQKCVCGCLNSVSSPKNSLVDEAIEVVEVLVVKGPQIGTPNYRYYLQTHSQMDGQISHFMCIDIPRASHMDPGLGPPTC